MGDRSASVQGVGLGFRLGLAEAMLEHQTPGWDFIELCPENYVGVGGRRARLLDAARERWPVVCHGLCGDLAGQAPLDHALLGAVRELLGRVGARWYSDHLCMTHIDGAEIHELVALPFNEAAARRCAARVVQVREILGVPMAIENVSAYGQMPGGEMDEVSFVRAVAEEADCQILLDVNTVYVNAINFGFDPRAYIDALPLERVVQIHMAGHLREAEDLLLDTHAMPIVDPVYDLFDYTLKRLPRAVPALLERDGNFPPLAELEGEMARMARIMEASAHDRP